MKITIENYYCDDCKKQVENCQELYPILYELRSNYSGSIGKIKKEVCKKCYDDYYFVLYQTLKDMMNKVKLENSIKGE